MSDAGAGIATIQAKRTVESTADIDNMNADELGETGQFLATLMVLQGIAEIPDGDKAVLISKFRQWSRRFPGRLAEDTSERCLALLEDNR